MSWLVGFLSGLLGYVLMNIGCKWLSVATFVGGACLVYLTELSR